VLEYRKSKVELAEAARGLRAVEAQVAQVSQMEREDGPRNGGDKLSQIRTGACPSWLLFCSKVTGLHWWLS
jgi:hypothetical protein